MNNRDIRIIEKIITEIEIIEQLIDGFNEEKFIADERTKRATCMTLINIGELTKNLTDDFKTIYSYIPWRGISGMRDITAHKYQTLKMGDVWITIENDIPDFKKQISEILNNI